MKKKPTKRLKRRLLIVTYDITGLTKDEIYHLTLEAVVQGESSDGHPDVRVTTEVR